MTYLHEQESQPKTHYGAHDFEGDGDDPTKCAGSYGVLMCALPESDPIHHQESGKEDKNNSIPAGQLLKANSLSSSMTCDKCQRPFNYCFYINSELWLKAVGKTEGHVCAHCILEALGGLGWYIIHNEPLERIRKNQEAQ